uniref:Elongation of fatty acids protein n=1 Tax=Arcella intermedia TaxID=1963864 RepID=A0A6B2LFN9_9EUKA
MSDWKILAGVSVGYLYAIWFGYTMMKEQEAMKLGFLKMGHNIILFSLSLIMFIGILYEATNTRETLFGLICDPNNTYNRGPIFFWIWIFHLTKFYELLDTLILVLSKRPLTFLHVYHHLLTLFITWYGVYAKVTFQWWGLLLNSFVHVLMYYYYALRDTPYGKNIWWKRHLTQLQMVQFVVNLFVGVAWFYWELTYDCSGDVIVVGVTVFAQFTFLFLFIRFFARAYPENKTKTT